jgi:hypothetical protein
MDDTKQKLIQQCQRGIWEYDADREGEVFARIDAIKDKADVQTWREWMMTAFPVNVPAH